MKADPRDSVQFLMSMGLPFNAAVAAVGHGIQESGLNPTASHDGGTGFGMFGWRDTAPGVGRWTNLRNFAASQHADVNDPHTQLSFLASELNGPEAGVGKRLFAAQTPEQAAQVFMDYERPQGWTAANPTAGDGWANRRANTLSVAGMFGGDQGQVQPTAVVSAPQAPAQAPGNLPTFAQPGTPQPSFQAPQRQSSLAGMFAPQNPVASGLQALAQFPEEQRQKQAADSARKARLASLFVDPYGGA